MYIGIAFLGENDSTGRVFLCFRTYLIRINFRADKFLRTLAARNLKIFARTNFRAPWILKFFARIYFRARPICA